MLEKQIIAENNYRYIELGEGSPVVILHGLMGGLSNFMGVINYFPTKGYKILVPELPVYELPLINSTVKSLAEFLDGFLNFKELQSLNLMQTNISFTDTWLMHKVKVILSKNIGKLVIKILINPII